VKPLALAARAGRYLVLQRVPVLVHVTSASRPSSAFTSSACASSTMKELSSLIASANTFCGSTGRLERGCQYHVWVRSVC
jgi:hypothetical protein